MLLNLGAQSKVTPTSRPGRRRGLPSHACHVMDSSSIDATVDSDGPHEPLLLWLMHQQNSQKANRLFSGSGLRQRIGAFRTTFEPFSAVSAAPVILMAIARRLQAVRSPLLPLILLAAFAVVGNLFVTSIDPLPPASNENIQVLQSHLSQTLTVANVLQGPAQGGPIAQPSPVAIEPDPIDRASRPVVRPTNYIVTDGDTLSTVATMFGVKTATLKYANHLTNVDNMQVGQNLVIPSDDYSDTELAKFAATEQAKLATASKKATSRGKVLLTSSDRISAAASGWILPLHYTRIARGVGTGHMGVDYDAPTGTPVYSSCSGTVIDAGHFGAWNGGFGNYILVNCGGGITMRYAHLSAYAAEAASGGAIGQGERIGSVGSTGNSTGPHLHLQVERGGVPFDPGIR